MNSKELVALKLAFACASENLSIVDGFKIRDIIDKAENSLRLREGPESFYTRVKALLDKTRNPNPKFYCQDCKLNADCPQLFDSLWESIAGPTQFLCITCTCKRLGRPLELSDLDLNAWSTSIVWFMENG